MHRHLRRGMRVGFAAAIAALVLATGTAARAQEGGAKPAEPPRLTEAQEKTLEAAFRAGNALLKEKQYAGALAEYRKALGLFPDSPALLWNGGMAAFFARDYPTALTLYQRLKAQDPTNGSVLAKLVQTYQASGDRTNRDAERKALLALRGNGKDSSSLKTRPTFCRDQFTVGDRTVFAYETFEFKPRIVRDDALYFAVRYDFLVYNPDDTLDVRVEVGWNTPEKVAGGAFKPGGAYYFDAYYPKGPFSRKTFGLFEQELDYDDTKRHLLNVLAGKVEMTGGSPRKEPK